MAPKILPSHAGSNILEWVIGEALRTPITQAKITPASNACLWRAITAKTRCPQYCNNNGV
jgi:hypothetical protein